MDGQFVSYLRISKAGGTGLGIDAQRQLVAGYLNGGAWKLLGEFVEEESGKGSNALARRPKLREALVLAKRARATLVIAKLDRLARNVHFVSGLMESGVPFVAADMPTADRFQLHLFAALAEKEREMISARTVASLAQVKAKLARGERHVSRRGAVVEKLGGPLAGEIAERNRADALVRLEPLAPTLRALQAEGLSVRKMVERLNDSGALSPGGRPWHVANLHRALKRLESANAP